MLSFSHCWAYDRRCVLGISQDLTRLPSRQVDGSRKGSHWLVKSPCVLCYTTRNVNKKIMDDNSAHTHTHTHTQISNRMEWKPVGHLLASVQSQHSGNSGSKSSFTIAIVWCQNATTVTALCQQLMCLDIILQPQVVCLGTGKGIVLWEAHCFSQLLLCCLRG